MKIKAARRLFKQQTGDFITFPGKVGTRYRIKLLGKIPGMFLKGNEKIIDGAAMGVNTEFRGRFSIRHLGVNRYLLNYDLPGNSWKVSRIRDVVNFVIHEGQEIGIGRFYWKGVPVCWFTMEKVKPGEVRFKSGILKFGKGQYCNGINGGIKEMEIKLNDSKMKELNDWTAGKRLTEEITLKPIFTAYRKTYVGRCPRLNDFPELIYMTPGVCAFRCQFHRGMTKPTDQYPDGSAVRCAFPGGVEK